MKIVQIDDVPLTSSHSRGGSGHRNRYILTSATLNRDPNRLDNFYFGISYLEKGEFHTPRHRHDFSQYRYMIEGEADYHVGAPQTDGVLGYFPEGAYYGPQKDGAGVIVICQFGDASGNGYIDRDEMRKALVELRGRNEGVFEDGVYYRNPGIEGKPVQDGNEALFEYIRGRPVAYPPTGYLHTILIDSHGLPWTPIDVFSGAWEKEMGVFGPCKTPTGQYRLDPGASLVLAGRGVYLVLSGAGRVEDQPYAAHTTVYLETGEHARFEASAETVLLFLGLPDLAAIEAARERLKTIAVPAAHAAPGTVPATPVSPLPPT